jgi:hypothetical protein
MNNLFLGQTKARLIVKILGIIQLLIGCSTLVIAPIEIYSFFLFSEGEVFYYDGFGIGSFIHGLIVAQIFAFYVIGLLFIIIGYGHIKLKNWTLNLSISSIWFWIIFGLPVMVFFLPLLAMKEINTQYPILLLTFAALLLIVAIPGLLLFFYNQKSVIELFHSPDNKGNVSQIMPVRSFLVLFVLSLFILLFHILIFYHGIFPLFGKFLTGLSGITIYGFLILIMILLIYGIINKVYISWIVSIILFSILTVSSIITLISYKYTEIIELLKFPKLENDVFLKVPLKSIYLLIPVLYILTASLIIIIGSKKYFNKQYGI